MLPTKIDWQLLFRIAKKHDILLDDISINTTGMSTNTLRLWGENTSRPTQPRLDRALAVYNFLWEALPDGEAEKCLVFKHGD